MLKLGAAAAEVPYDVRRARERQLRTREEAEAWAARFNERVPPGKDLIYEAQPARRGWKVRARHPQKEARPRFRERHPDFWSGVGGAIASVLVWGTLVGGCGYLVATSDTEPQGSVSGADCHPDYGDCLDPDALDYDCAGGGGDGPEYVSGPIEVTGADPFELDGDGDGIGCDY